MEQATERPFDTTVKVRPGQTNVWAPAGQPIREAEANPSGLVEYFPLKDHQQPIGKIHACKISQRSFQLARDRLKRADRDLGETAAFIAASLTTVTAVEAVISIAVDKIGLSGFPLLDAFKIYLTVILFILLYGLIRGVSAVRGRRQAEREIDEAKKGIYEFCISEQWPKGEE